LKTPPARYLWLAAVLVCSGGASCQRWTRQTDPLAPVAFTAPPTLNEILYHINTNTAKVAQLSTESATLSMAEAPKLRASLALERPLRLRLRGRFVTQELDVGSNDQLFWFWAKADPAQAVYYAYHEPFVHEARHQILPVGPEWLIDALGLVTLDPAGFHEGPVERPDGAYEIRSRVESRGAVFTRVLVIDGKYGWIREQQILDSAGRLAALARSANHRSYVPSGVTLPHRIQVELRPAQVAFQLEVASYAVNQLSGDPNELFTRPLYEQDGYHPVNLAEEGAFTAQPDPRAASSYVPQETGLPHTTYRLRYRGFAGQY
jgi:hypothetical protein